ncbi:GIP, partial [Symbiodinium sp. KB8]
QIREEAKSIESVTILEDWLKKVALEKYEDPRKILKVVKELNRCREDAETPEKKKKEPSEAGSDPSSSSSDDDGSEGDKGEERASSSVRPEDVERRKDELRKLLTEQLQQQEVDPQARQMEKRANELLDLQESAKRRRRNLAKDAVEAAKAKASKPSESSSSEETEKEEEKKEEPKESGERPEEPVTAEQAGELKEAEKPAEVKTAKEPEKEVVQTPDEAKEDGKLEEEKGEEEEEEVDPAEMSIAGVCRDKYHLSENAVEMLLEQDKQDSVHAALEILENSVEDLPRGYGNHLERLSVEFDRWTSELAQAIAITEDEVETDTIRRDGTQSNREDALARKAEAELKKLEAESEIQAAENDVKRYDEQLEEIMNTRADLKAGRQAVRETHQVSERVLQMLNHVVKQLRNVGSLNEGVKQHLFQDEEKKGNVQLQMLRMMMQSAKRKSGTETPRSMPSVAVTDDEGDGRRKRVKGTDKPAEPAGEPPKEKVRPAPRVAPDIIKEHQSKEAQKEKQQDRKRELENVNEKWLVRQERREKEMLKQAKEAGRDVVPGETFSFKFLAYVGCLLTFVSSLGISAKDTGASNLGIRLNTASDSHPEAVFFDTLSWVQSKKVNCKWVGWYDCAAKYCPLHASWLKQAAAGANNDPAGTFARLYSECQAYEDRVSSSPEQQVTLLEHIQQGSLHKHPPVELCSGLIFYVRVFWSKVTPDCLFFTMGKQGFRPASYAQTLLRLRNFLQVTMLSWMAQLDLPLPARARLFNVGLPPCFLSIVEASQKSDDTAPAAPNLSLSPEPGMQPPKPLCRAPRFEDSDGDLGPEPEHDSTEQNCPAGVPAWKSDGPAETTTVAETAAPSKATPTCADVRFLLSSSGSENCVFRCQPACGCFSEFTTASVLPSGARLCRRRACVIASAATAHLVTRLHALPTSARDPALSLFGTPAIMSKTPFSADYIHKLLKTIPEAEREKFLEMLETQPILEQQPASGSSGAPALDLPPQQTDPTPQTLDEFCDTVAQEAYAQPASASPAAPPPKKDTSARTAKRPRCYCCKARWEKAPPPPLNFDDTTTGPASQPPTQGAPNDSWQHSNWEWNSEWNSNVWYKKEARFQCLGASHFEVSMAAEFFSLMNESSIPDNIREALASYDTPLFARSCNDQDELASLINHLMEASDTSALGDQIMARASVRLLFSRCRESCGLPPLDAVKGTPQPTGSASPPSAPPAPNAGSSWQESWPAKLSAERTAELRKRFEDDYPTELLDSDSFPSSRLLALTSKMVADKEIRWLPWKFRLSAKAQDDSLLIRPKKLPRLTELSDLLLDEAPSRDIHDGPASFNLINQLLTLATNSIALCRGAHLGSLKLYQKEFLKLCFVKYESASKLRGPTSLEAQAADKRAWELIGELVNIHAWKLDDALHEVTQVRADLSTLLAPRAQLPKHLFQLKEPWRNRQDGKGNRPHLRGNGKGLKGKHDSSSHAEDPPPERATRGGKGKKGATASAGSACVTSKASARMEVVSTPLLTGPMDSDTTLIYFLTCARLAQHVAHHSEKPLFTEEDWDFSVPPGQPYCLSALSRLSHLIADKDTSLFPALMQGVPTGFDKGNWKDAEDDPALLQQLIEEELEAGYLEVVPDLETAFRRWGKERVAVGKVNIVKAPGRSPRLVVDNSICNTNHCCHVPEQFSMPSLQDIQSSFPVREDNEEVQGFSLDVKGWEASSLAVFTCLSGWLTLRMLQYPTFVEEVANGPNYHLDRYHASNWTSCLVFYSGFFMACTAIRQGAKLLSARHFEMHAKADLVKVPVSTKRIWLRVADPSSSRRKLCSDSIDVLRFFKHLSSVEWRPRPLRPPALVAVATAADAFGKGNRCGIGGWLRFPSGRIVWFSQLFEVHHFTALGIPVQSNANLDISSYETLAQCFVFLAFWKYSGAGRLALKLPALSDNSGAEAVCNKLYTSKAPLNLFVRKLCTWSALSGISLECSHIAGENDDADFLSRWDGNASTLPSRFRSEDRFPVDLPAFWNVQFSVSLFPQDAKLLWKLPASYTLGPASTKPAN